VIKLIAVGMAELEAVPVAPAPHASTEVSAALREFSEVLWDLQDVLSEGQYTELCKRAQALANVARKPPPPSNPAVGWDGGARVDSILERVRGHIGTVQDLQTQVDGYETQLDAATVTIDEERQKLKVVRRRRDYYAKAVSALKGVCVSHKIPDEKLLAAYARQGIKEQVLVDREKKRKRDEELPPEAAVEISSADEESD
jgi:hypothetical protein